MRLLPKSIHRCRRYPTKFNSGRDIPFLRTSRQICLVETEEITSLHKRRFPKPDDYPGARVVSSSASKKGRSRS